MAYTNGGNVESAGSREYGRQNLVTINKENPLFRGFDDNSQVWMSHGDTITRIPDGAEVIASTQSVSNAAYYRTCSQGSRRTGYQQHGSRQQG